MGGKWNRKEKGHVFTEDPTVKIEEVLLTGETINKKQLYQFFETPKHLAEKICDMADIGAEDLVLEPSAGHGAIAECVKSKLLDCVEIDPEKCEVLRKKGLNVFNEDFMKFDRDMEWERIVMNPPFTKQQDIDHVLRAFSFLAKGGHLVAVMSPGFTFRQNIKSTSFLRLVEEYGMCEELPEETFKESGTLVRTVLVTLSK